MTKWSSLRRIWAPFSESGASVHAACSCFYLQLSLLPSASFFLALLPYIPTVQQSLLSLLFQTIPAPFHPMLSSIWRQFLSVKSPAILSASGVMLLWSSSKGLWAITNGLNALSGSNFKQNYWKHRLRAICLLAVAIPGLFLILQITIWSQQLFPGFFLSSQFLAFIVIGILFTVIYRYLPNKRFPLRSTLPAGLCSAFSCIVFSRLFSLYVQFFSKTPEVYGGIGLAALSFLWLHLCLLQFFYGSVLTRLLSEGSYHPFRFFLQTFRNRS